MLNLFNLSGLYIKKRNHRIDFCFIAILILFKRIKSLNLNLLIYKQTKHFKFWRFFFSFKFFFCFSIIYYILFISKAYLSYKLVKGTFKNYGNNSLKITQLSKKYESIITTNNWLKFFNLDY